MDEGHEEAAATHGAAGQGGALPGLAVSQDDLSLVPESTRVEAGSKSPFVFSIEDAAGHAVQEFDSMHERRMHLIAVRRDLQAFQHVHPVQAKDGSWSVELDMSLPGVYRVYADFSVGGEPVTLATDLFVSGDASFRDLPAPAATASAGDGYEVTLVSGEPRSGTSPARFEVTRNGEAVAVEPYLGADGHLVALREHDLAFLHTHPEGDPGGGPIEFDIEYPSRGRYRLFLQFKVDGVVRTAAFTQEVQDDQR
jgi:hypothetical protein